MAITLEIQESAPLEYPEIDNLPDARFGTDADAIWQRIECWIGHRWGKRDVIFIVEGPGDWTPPLVPFSTLTIEVWHDDEWVSAVVPPTPLGGYRLDFPGPFRFAGVAGSTDAPPPAVKEAYRRLITYSSSIIGHDGGAKGAVTRSDYAGENAGGREFVNGWAGKAIQYSGAADLLRPWRHQGAN